MQNAYVIITKLIDSKKYFCKEFFCNYFGRDGIVETQILTYVIIYAGSVL